MGAAMPASFQNSQLQPGRSPKKSSCPVVAIRVSITKFEDGPPLRIWFGVYHSHSSKLTQLYLTFPADSRKYVDSTRNWTFDFCLYEHLVNQLQASEFDFVELVELPRFLAVGIKKYIANITKYQLQRAQLKSIEVGKVAGIETGVGAGITEEDSLNIETSLLDVLLPFQLEGIQFVVRHGGKALIGDDMGCGKTIQAVGVMQHYRNHWPVLMLVPVCMVYQWQSELLKFSGDLLKEKEIFIAKKGTDSVSGKICIVPYSLLEKLVDNGRIRPEQFGIVVADESHNLKNKDAKRTNMALPFLKAATVSLCLTGTPATNRPVELFTQLNGLLPLIFNDYDQFTKRYCDAKPSNFGQKADVRGSSNEAELKLLLEGMVMIRRMKSAVLKNLPGKDRIVEYVVPDPVYVPEMKRMQSRMSAIDKTLRDQPDADIVKELQTEQRILLTTLYNVTGMSKLESIKSTLLKLIHEARKDKEKAEAADNTKIQNIKDSELEVKNVLIMDKNVEVELHGDEEALHAVEVARGDFSGCFRSAEENEKLSIEYLMMTRAKDEQHKMQHEAEVKVIEGKEVMKGDIEECQSLSKYQRKGLKRRYSAVKGSFACTDSKAVLMCLEGEDDELEEDVNQDEREDGMCINDVNNESGNDDLGFGGEKNLSRNLILPIKLELEEREAELDFGDAVDPILVPPTILSVPHLPVPTPLGPFTSICTGTCI